MTRTIILIAERDMTRRIIFIIESEVTRKIILIVESDVTRRIIHIAESDDSESYSRLKHLIVSLLHTYIITGIYLIQIFITTPC